MQFNDVLFMVEDQDRGKWFPLLHPVTGEPAGMRFRVAGPDSRAQAKAMAIMTDELAEMADATGRVAGEDQARAQVQLLARIVLDWDVTEGGEPLPLTFDRAVKLLSVAWVRAQVDAFAASRRVYFEGEADAAA
ncbi:hypothetical protein [Pseudogemmobacter faecipullorum]|uniref:Tail assembly chaperone n=1 Tax=Pseudogemmobacter faecipullorum TaxID=2755041 RepID=A0ABS8CPB0_9RHOB|nr:hypothetical protein [Pseudogemmobacter faecipullorum]MCB5411028.1 hypothetical protein [Pseudogemmobacter faecipullorum]